MRVPGWESEFYAELARVRAGFHKFAYGERDCCLFAADMVEICTGKDYAKSVRGTYQNRRGAVAMIRAYGSLEGLVTAILKTGPVEPAFAKRGDPVLASIDGLKAVGVCDGSKGVFISRDTTRSVPINDCLAAWLT